MAVIMFDAATGKQKWSAALPISSFVVQTPGSTNLAAALASNTLAVTSGTNPRGRRPGERQGALE